MRSPASSVVVYITGKPPCASNAAESDSPVFTRVDTSSSCAAKCRVLLALGQHLERAENRQAGADQRQKLLVEDEKRLQLDLAPRPRRAMPPRAAPRRRSSRPARSGVRSSSAVAADLHLLLHAATLIGQLDDELCHGFSRRPGAPPRRRTFL